MRDPRHGRKDFARSRRGVRGVYKTFTLGARELEIFGADDIPEILEELVYSRGFSFGKSKGALLVVRGEHEHLEVDHSSLMTASRSGCVSGMRNSVFNALVVTKRITLDL